MSKVHKSERFQLFVKDAHDRRSLSRQQLMPKRPSTTTPVEKKKDEAPGYMRPKTPGPRQRRAKPDEQPEKKEDEGEKKKEEEEHFDDSHLHPDGMDLSYYVEVIAQDKLFGQAQLFKRNRKVAEDVCGDVIGRCLHSDPLFHRYFLDLEGVKRTRASSVEEIIRIETKSPYEYDCKVYFKRVSIPHSFKSGVGLTSGLAAGRATYKLNDDLLPQQKSVLRQEWRDCLDSRGYFSPAAVSSWFCRGIMEAVFVLKEGADDQEKVEWAHTATAVCCPPTISLVLPLHVKDAEEKEPEKAVPLGQRRLSTWGRSDSTAPPPKERDDVYYITVNIYPAVPCSGWPQGVDLKFPFPRQKPFSAEGSAVVAKIKRKVEDGAAMWYLDGKTSQREQEHHASARSVINESWRMRLTPAMERLYVSLTKSRPEISLAFEVIAFLASRNEANSDIITEELLRTLLMNETRKTFDLMETTGQIFLKLLAALTKSLNQGSVAHYMMPNQNLLATAEKEQLDTAAAEITQLLEWSVKNPKALLKYAGCSYLSRFPKLKAFKNAFHASYRLDNYNTK